MEEAGGAVEAGDVERRGQPAHYQRTTPGSSTAGTEASELDGSIKA